jgi:hypothetical protein
MTEVFQVLSSEQALFGILAEIAGFRRKKPEADLFGLLRSAPDDVMPKLIWAVGRLYNQRATAELLNYVDKAHESVGSAAALALLRLGESRAIRYCVEHVNHQNWTLILLGLAGGPSVIALLMQLQRKRAVSSDALIALGLLGDASLVPYLLTCLSNEEFAGAAAVALNLITGAELREEVFVPDVLHEDELFEQEQQMMDGETSIYKDGKPFGVNVIRLAQASSLWNRWWDENQSAFAPGIRYRSGKPYSPACLLEGLISERTPRKVRQLVHEELVIRYRLDVPFESDMFVDEQLKALAKTGAWVRSNGPHFQEGAWYYGGERIS